MGCVLTFWWWWWLITSTPSSSSWSKSSSRWSVLCWVKEKRSDCPTLAMQWFSVFEVWVQHLKVNLPSAMADDDEPQPIKSDDVSWCVVRSCFTSSKPMSPRCIIILDILGGSFSWLICWFRLFVCDREEKLSYVRLRHLTQTAK